MIEIITILMMFGLGYAIGRRVGIKQGAQLGFVQAVIDLRINGLEYGICPICNHDSEAAKKNENDGLDSRSMREY